MNLKGLHLSQKMKYSHGINQNQRSIISVPPRWCNGQRFRLAIKRLRFETRLVHMPVMLMTNVHSDVIKANRP